MNGERRQLLIANSQHITLPNHQNLFTFSSQVTNIARCYLHHFLIFAFTETTLAVKSGTLETTLRVRFRKEMGVDW